MTIEPDIFSGSIHIRASNQPGDDEFIFGCYENGMREHVEWAWGWEAGAQRLGFWRHLPLAGFRIVESGGAAVGMMFVEDGETSHVLRMIVLLPAFQNRGLGSHLISTEIHRANCASKPLLLNVIKSNRAKALYERLGLLVDGEDPQTFSMSTQRPLSA